MDFEFQTLDTLINLSPLSQKDNTVESSLFLQDKWSLSQRLFYRSVPALWITPSMTNYILTQGLVSNT